MYAPGNGAARVDIVKQSEKNNLSFKHFNLLLTQFVKLFQYLSISLKTRAQKEEKKKMAKLLQISSL